MRCAPAKFDAAERHHHQPGSTAAQCVNCHMPTKTYTVVDVRRDHSFRVPRPDLSVALGTPNACTQCHKERSAEWAAQTVNGWYPGGRQTTPHYGTTLPTIHSSGPRRRARSPSLRRGPSSKQPFRCSVIPFKPCASRPRGNWPEPTRWR
jgi:hypothetical protein